jgi:hypothetical protein
MTRRFLHSTSWSSFDAWSWCARLRVDTISATTPAPTTWQARPVTPSSAAPASACCDGCSCFVLGGASPDGRPLGFVLEHREHPPGWPDSTAPKDLPRSRPNRLRRAGSPVHPKCLGFAELSAVNHTLSTATSSNLSVIPSFCILPCRMVQTPCQFLHFFFQIAPLISNDVAFSH